MSKAKEWTTVLDDGLYENMMTILNEEELTITSDKKKPKKKDDKK